MNYPTELSESHHREQDLIEDLEQCHRDKKVLEGKNDHLSLLVTLNHGDILKLERQNKELRDQLESATKERKIRVVT